MSLPRTEATKAFVQKNRQSTRWYFILQLVLIAVILTGLWKTGVLATIWQQIGGKNCTTPLLVLKQQIEEKNSHLEKGNQGNIEAYRQEVSEVEKLVEKYENLQRECENN